MSHGPVEAEQREVMNALANGLDEVFNPDQAKKTVAFVLLTARFGDVKDGRVNYISNGAREEMVAMLRELLARFEGSEDAPGMETVQ